jgi:hypothetical protein
MDMAMVVDGTVSSRDLVRTLRRGVVPALPTDAVLPESVAWHAFLELRRRDDPRAAELFVDALRQLHARRTLGTVELPVHDALTEEHRLVADPMLADLWKAYKKCICSNRTGPASQLLRDIESQLAKLDR